MKTEFASTNLARYAAQQLRWRVDDRVGHITLDRPDRRNPLIFKPYADVRDLCRTVVYVHGEIVERLYRQIRLLRSCAGASEVHKQIIGREFLK